MINRKYLDPKTNTLFQVIIGRDRPDVFVHKKRWRCFWLWLVRPTQFLNYPWLISKTCIQLLFLTKKENSLYH